MFLDIYKDTLRGPGGGPKLESLRGTPDRGYQHDLRVGAILQMTFNDVTSSVCLPLDGSRTYKYSLSACKFMVFFIQGPTGRELTELKIHGEEFMSIFKTELRVFP